MAIGLLPGLNADGHHLSHLIGRETVTWRCQCGEHLGIEPLGALSKQGRPRPTVAVLEANIKHRADAIRVAA